MKKRHFVFGYASLIERESRARTTPRAFAAYPVSVKYIARGWWAHGVPFGFSTCFLGARRTDDDAAVCNGVIYEVSEVELEQTDRREGGYDRVEIAAEHITMLDGRAEPPEDATVWVYVMPDDTPDNVVPTPQFPIVQSYVDLCLNGALQMEELYPAARAAHFAETFIKTTLDWNRYWVNDRLYPRRPFIFVPRAYQIDYLLKTHLPELFAHIQLQPAHWD